MIVNKKISKGRYAYLIATLPIWFPLALLGMCVIICTVIFLQGGLALSYVFYRTLMFIYRAKPRMDIDSWSREILNQYTD